MADAASSSEPPILPSDPEPETIEHLRRYSNYMSPKLGLLSADTWALVGTFLRNLLLIWLVLIPLIVAALAIPRFAVSVASWNTATRTAAIAAILIAFIAGIVCVAYMIASLPSWPDQSSLVSKYQNSKSLFGKIIRFLTNKSEARFLQLCWVPLVLSALLSAAYWSWIHIAQGKPTEMYSDLGLRMWPFILFGLLLHIIGYLIARIFLVKRAPWKWLPELYDFGVRAATGILGGVCLWAATQSFSAPPVTILQHSNQPVKQSTAERTTAPVVVQMTAPLPSPTVSPTPSSSPLPAEPAVTSLMVSTPGTPTKVEVSVMPQPTPDDPMAKAQEERKNVGIKAGLYAMLSPTLFVLMFLIAAVVFIGFASTYTNDADREWMARSGGWMLIFALGWSALCGLVIFGPVGLILLWQKFQVSLLSVSTITGVLTLVGGFSSKTAANKKQSGKDAGIVSQVFSLGLPVVATIFAVIVLAALSLATSSLMAYSRAILPGFMIKSSSMQNFYQTVSKLPANQWWHLLVLYESPTKLVLLVIVVILLVGLVMGLVVNINKFSLHSAYRDRLIRAYLGASNVSRHPNPFTGFDDLDNVQMHNLLTELFRPRCFEEKLGDLVECLKGDQTEAVYIRRLLSDRTRNLMKGFSPSDKAVRKELAQALSDDFNHIINSEALCDRPEFKKYKAGIEELETQPQVPLLHIFDRPVSIKPVFVQKLLINRKLVEKAFFQCIETPDQLGFDKEPRPMHVVNIALNLVGGKELAWQERKAQPFTVSPLHAGSYGLGYRDVKKYAISRQQNGALTLGTSLAISGAAVSPNMGYNSSSAVTFLLMLFNVRLGWWLGNPGKAGWKTYMKPSPFFTPKPLVAETLGMTDSEHPYVYLSDGAHFENLALYEMVRRRCHYIFLSDAGADGEFNFDDLGNAMRKIRIDLGVPIKFEWEMPIQLRVEKLFAADCKAAGKYCALARIKYSEVDGTDAKDDGWLIYIKPTVYGIETQDVQNYAKANSTFPHETTGDQMYSESQFESYRSLGENVIENIIGKGEVEDLPKLFNRVKKNLGIEIEDKPPPTTTKL